MLRLSFLTPNLKIQNKRRKDMVTSVTGRMRRETCRSICKLYSKTWSKTQAWSKHQQTGITQARQRVILGQAWVFDRQTISRGLEKRGSQITWAIIQTSYNQSPNGETKGKSKKHGKETKHEKTDKARLRQLRGFHIAAKTGRVINAEQYGKETETQNGSVRQLTPGEC